MRASTNLSTGPLKVLVPKGRMETQVVEALAEKGLVYEKAASRSLYYTCDTLPVTLIPLKSQDILTYMDRGLSDFAILGEDMLAESQGPYEVLAALSIGACRMSLAGYPNFPLSRQVYLRIASKYPSQAARVLRDLGIEGEVITLSSSVELAPILGFADAILDIVETGATLKDNGLVEWFPIRPIASVVIGHDQKLLPKDLSRALNTLIAALPRVALEVGYALCS